MFDTHKVTTALILSCFVLFWADLTQQLIYEVLQFSADLIDTNLVDM